MSHAAQQAAYVMIDAAVAYDGPTAATESAMNLALERLGEIDGLVNIEPPTAYEADVDLSQLVNGSIVSIVILASWLAAERGCAVEEVLGELREQHSTLWPATP